jgi:N-acetyl-anhydromuramyl-L-alanine amidase AmpD
MVMKRIIVHWTAGTNQPNSTDYEHYHYLISGDGIVVNGKFTPADNENCNDGAYAQHTGGGNTGSIGIALCGMCGFSSRTNVGKYPLTKVQCEKAFKLIAELAKKYKITISSETVMTHYEFGIKHPKTSSAGKIDIIYLPPYPDVEQSKIGDYIRSKARWYYSKL